MNEDGEVFIEKSDNWNIYQGKGYFLAITKFGSKTMHAYVFGSDSRRVECVVRITDSKNNNYIATVAKGELIENWFYHKDGEIIERKNNLKEYLPVIHTLPDKIKEGISPLIL